VAVPKYLKLEILPASSMTVPPNSSGNVTQEMKITNTQQGEKNIMLKLKLTYKAGGNSVGF
jgi:AP-1 complex subunit gamma-1